MQSQQVYHPQFGAGTLLKTFMGGFEWEVQFESGRRFRLPAREFDQGSYTAIYSENHARPLPARTVVLDMDQFRAQQTLEALRVGVVPVQDAEMLTIGLEAEQVTLDRALDRTRERSGDVLAVIGDYGFGKSHFIELAARRALRGNFLAATASLDLVEVPPSKAHKIYEALVTSLRYPDTDARGLLPLLNKALANPAVIAQFAEICPREPKNCPLTEGVSMMSPRVTSNEKRSLNCHCAASDAATPPVFCVSPAGSLCVAPLKLSPYHAPEASTLKRLTV